VRGELSELIDRLGQSQLNSTLGDDGLKRLGTLLECDKSNSRSMIGLTRNA